MVKEPQKPSNGKKPKVAKAGLPAPIPPRTPEEEAVVQGYYGKKPLDKPVSFESRGRDVRLKSADRDLARARLGTLMHAVGDNHLFTLVGKAGASLGIRDHVDAMDTLVGIVHGIDPQDHLEALLAMQMAATHMTSLEMLRRAHGDDLSTQTIDACVTRATRLMRTFTAQVVALKDYRSKGHQTVTVQHVDVRDGGQAIVGQDVVLNRPGVPGGGGS
jgi:hypothetical protein